MCTVLCYDTKSDLQATAASNVAFSSVLHFCYTRRLKNQLTFSNNSPGLIYMFYNSDMTPRLSGRFSVFCLVLFVLKSPLRIARQWSR